MLRLLADPTRLRILAALDGGELAVNEIAEVLAMGQSRISNHLRLLKGAGALHDRREGAWTFYENALPGREDTAALWSAVHDGLDAMPEVRADSRRRRAVLERRRQRSREHFARGNGADGPALEAGCLREEILAALVPVGLAVVDAGCGDGFLTELLAERCERVVGVDHSPERLAVARARLDAGNVAFEQGEVDALPLRAGSMDVVIFSMVLHHVPDIGAALADARRVLRPGGRVVVADLAPHGEEALRETVADLRLGLDPSALGAALEAAGFERVRLLPARDRLVAGRRKLDLFLATGERPRRAKKKKKSSNRRRKRSRT